MNKKNPYSHIGKFVLRTPSFSIQNDFDNLLKSDSFWEAIYLASPALYKECRRKNFELDEGEKKSVYKYYVRSTTRCTPFGLFAGCSVGEISNKTEIKTVDLHYFNRKTRLDMYFLSALVDKIEHIQIIRHQLKYKLNTSLYKINDNIRYIEYSYEGVKRIHKIVCIERNPYLDKVLQILEKELSFNEIVAALVDDEIDIRIAEEFVDELIEYQALMSELEIHVTGKDVLDSLIDKLSKLEHSEWLCTSLKKISNLLSNIDNLPIGSTIELYKKIINEIKKLDISYDEHYLFQTDLFKPVIKAEISDKIINDIKELLFFLNKITPKSGINTGIEKFKNKFYSRYEEQEVPLMKVLDSDCGIGYGKTNPNVDFNTLVKDIIFPSNNPNVQNRIDLSRHYINEFILGSWNNTKEIVWNDDMIKDTKEDWSISPESLNICISLVKDDTGNDLILLNGISSGATNVLGRFCHLDTKIFDMVKHIADWEQKKKPDAIIAAIAHLPFSRMGNIIFRPDTIRSYEIPYLSGSCLSPEYCIPVSDLIVSVRNNKINLRSKKHKKTVIPKLDNAHNYNKEPTPVYNFLCNMQELPEIDYLSFRYDEIFNYFDYIPRIRYKNLIVKKAQWKIRYSDIKEKEVANSKELVNYLKARNIPRYICIAQGDNILDIDCEKELAINILFGFIKQSKSTIQIEESFNCKSCYVVHDTKENPFLNEIIIPFLKK
jgi:hypothetical protein